jgi:uncharacterized protein YyaL (SSP411 family)
MYKYNFLLSIILAFSSCQSQTPKKMEETHKYTNDLIKETSPYLLQHAHNPVNWHAWNKETLALAKKENKLILISIGYAACHWCHVMEHESFEDEAVAKLMNANFICIKVDREERPDIDQVYMAAVQLLTGSGGWPLNAIALPDGRPFYGGTYFSKEQWIQALEKVSDLHKNEPKKVEEYAERLAVGIKQTDLVQINTSEIAFSKNDAIDIVNNWKPQWDNTYGGRKGSRNKFPLPNNYQFLLRYGMQYQDKNTLDYTHLTLEKMALGGIYDQIGGGFSRYSTDSKWHVPHFEKMLYDNGQLVSLYSDAYLAKPNELYKQTVYETLAFVERELMDKTGAFYSSLDADSNDENNHLEEGAFYVWKKAALEELLAGDFNLFADYFNINSYGQWEDGNYVLIRKETIDIFIKEHNISKDKLVKKITSWKKLLLEERSKRERPRLDDKSLTSWNGLMLKGYVDAYRVFGEQHFLDIALKNANFISKVQIRPDGGLNHNYKNGKSNINGYLEDYASVIDAFIALYEVTFDEQWLQKAKTLTNYSFDHFYDDSNHMFYFTSNADNKLITRSMETTDNVIPASNSMMAKNLFKLGHYFDNKAFKKTARQMLHNVSPKMPAYGAGYSNWGDLLLNYTGDYYEVALVGEEALTKAKAIQKHYIPNKLIAGSVKANALPLLKDRYMDGQTLIYVCVEQACKLPTSKVAEALALIDLSIK